MTQLLNTDAICLKLIPFRETDVIAAFYTADLGLIRAVCRGVRKANSKLVGACQLLTLNRLELKPSPGGLYTLRQYARLASFESIRQNLHSLSQASIWADVIYALGDDVDSQLIFSLLMESLLALEHLAPGSRDWIAVTLKTHKHLLELAGYGNDWTHCLSCGIEISFGVPFLVFSSRLGSFYCRDCAQQAKQQGFQDWVKVSPETLQLFLNPSQSQFDTAFDKLQAFLKHTWQFRLEKPLSSFDVAASMTSGHLASV